MKTKPQTETEPKVTVPPIALRIHLDANTGTPALASILAKLLSDAGAKVTFSDPRVTPEAVKKVTFEGAQIHIDRLTWVTQEEAARWGKPETK